MAEDNDSTEKTLEPTEKKLQDARKKGDVPSSKETGNMVVVLALLGIISFVLPVQTPKVMAALFALIEQSPTLTVDTGPTGVARLGEIMRDFTLSLTIAIAPMFAVLLAGAFIGAVIQGETVISFERIQPKLSKISPAQGLKRLFSANSIVEFLKSIVKVFAVGGFAIWFTLEAVQKVWMMAGFLPEYLPGYLIAASRKLLLAAALLLVPIAVADILWRRFDWRKKQRMSQKDLRDEMKESEGSPEVRGQRARRRLELSRQRTISVVPTASVILTNPTHYSVALKYDPDIDMAPICIAKGADLVALRIREVAFENDIPIVENKPLARMLYDTVEIDQVVPVEHWEIVAEIISFVFALNENRPHVAPKGSVLRDSPN
ncbi:flagellar biosynthesis protein FlhB [Sulfitobacter sp. M57]|uniref:flagellar biosynthesis protein FlhB n=1 Tax=unclassified Sulfitobacter TaxID=196795 RepID=UPI0023E0F44B|nr:MULTISPECIES: flagellar biosynthesis protein FlhB [unclassified Sulfitobacter]MDF3414827.1 flagellar biosynthesis protein FlhB [Sulfitobacter sp. KE5]MDF3422308.1 flagellar biosynthesis protein FlhB [Sulfitobacter sp. KE43]MDF3433373.1 flagellar biosynthesis protein FlhB [Sulfitobacter sp. KE42]MDF3459013.1 flagellar biosynthesis protein FlhB [Sulfitobacter sp. S74]MDF3462912.1 flagellar biosynthesis protein FlhB [Sulfitobacter sp. Ks18]